MKKYYIRDILSLIQDYKIIGKMEGYVTELSPINKAKEKSLVFADKNRDDKFYLIYYIRNMLYIEET